MFNGLPIIQKYSCETRPFTAISSISCVMADTFWWMASFTAARDASWSGYTFDFKNSHSQKSQGVRSGEALTCAKEPAASNFFILFNAEDVIGPLRSTIPFM
ncbi:hypothetical protein TNCV_871431 [Trichonephila clavipes]|nr:hypothetical protein TNCV_871431 [Trichonephila clavipes]